MDALLDGLFNSTSRSDSSVVFGLVRARSGAKVEERVEIERSSVDWRRDARDSLD